MRMIPQIQPWIDRQELAELTKVIKSTFITENKATELFEKKIKKLTKSKYVIAYANGTMAQYAALIAMNIGPGDEVIIPNITFIATANAVILTGATPVLCEVNKNNFCIDYKRAAKLITKKTKIIIPVHLYGQSSNMDEAIKFARKYKIQIFEDAAQGVGVKYRGKHVGTFGKAGILSFYGNKTITTAEGGIILTNSKKIAQKVFRLKNHGRNEKGTFRHNDIGYNFAFTELQAAIGISQLNKLRRIINKKKKVQLRYKEMLSNIPDLAEIKMERNCTPVYWFSSFLVKKGNKSLSSFLLKNNIQTRRFFYPLHMQPCYKNSKLVKNMDDDFSLSEKIYEQGLSLPSSYNLSNKQQNLVIKNIKKYYENRN